MKQFLRLQQKTAAPTDGVTAEPSEIRFRTWLVVAVMLVGPPLLLFFYQRAMFSGLTNPEALDFAQLGRNLSAGRGFVTDILRPLALRGDTNPLRQPEVIHGPLYPFLLALAFGALGAKDGVVAAVSGLFYLLTIPIVYLLGARVFHRSVGVIAALVFTLNALLLEYATSGLHITLYIFLTTSLLLVVYNLAAHAARGAAQPGAPLPRGQLLLAGILTAALYLTESTFFWIAPVILGAVAWIYRSRWLRAAGWFLLPVGVLVLPWWWRNWVVAGNPVFGLRGAEILMYTRTYPALTGYRLTPDELVPGAPLFADVTRKILLSASLVIQTYPQVTASWILAFFLPGLLFRFTDPAANITRTVLLLCVLSIFFGSLLFSVEMPLFVSTIPVMLAFAIAFLLHLVRQAQISRPGVVSLAALMGVVLLLPLVNDMALTDKTPHLREAALAQSLRGLTGRHEVTLSDQPWIVAWYADRPSIWIPATDTKIREIRNRFAEVRWLFLTEQVRRFSPEWQLIYDVFSRWNEAYTQARLANKVTPQSIRISSESGHPLLTALDGFTSIEPPEQDVSPAVIATAPRVATGAGERAQR